MTMKHYSGAALFTFVAFITVAHVQGKDHAVQIVQKGSRFGYNHTGGRGVNGFVYTYKGDTVKWSCPDGQCTALKITFPNGSPCKIPPVEGSTVSCDLNYGEKPRQCNQASQDQKCYKYIATLKINGMYVDVPDDPELIVDSENLITLLEGHKVIATVGGLGLLLLGFVGGYGFRRMRAAA
jgi:hypothetical protein